MISNRKKVHDKYHKDTHQQYKIISKNNFTYRIIISTLTPYLKEKMKILDIGCGAGTLDFYLANRGYDITGIDISEKAISECKKTAKNLNLKNVKFITEDFPNANIKGKYDLIIFTEVIEHLDDDCKALKVLHKALKPGGILYLSTPSKNAPLHRLGLTKDFDKRVGHLRRYSKEEITSLLDENNFKVIKFYEKEGIIRNSLYVNKYLGKTIRFLKGPLSHSAYLIDNFSAKIFGSSNMIIIIKK